jgi:hypothetical protein
MLRLPDSHPAAGIVGQLRGQEITCDSRGQTLRLSPGIMTTEAGLARLASALGAALLQA